MGVLTAQQKAFFHENGYVKISGLVDKQDCDRVIEGIWDFIGKDPADPENWYSAPITPATSGGMVELYHNQAMWDNRQNPRVYEAFSELWGEKRLWVSLDRVNMKPPARAEKPEYDNAFIHWDAKTNNLPNPIPSPYSVQGVLYLADTAENQGGFQCVPSIYRQLAEYLEANPEVRESSKVDITGHQIEKIAGKAGDLLIWDALLPHGNGHNYADKPRYAQYIAMNRATHPAPPDARAAVIDCWRNKKPNSGFPGDFRNWEYNKDSEPAKLTELGRKLLGLDAWE